jgi:hypothetical protein
MPIKANRPSITVHHIYSDYNNNVLWNPCWPEKPNQRWSPWRTTPPCRCSICPRRPASWLWADETWGPPGSINVFMLMSIPAGGPPGLRHASWCWPTRSSRPACSPCRSAEATPLSWPHASSRVGSGFPIVVTSMYNAEIWPASMGGFLSSFLDVRTCASSAHRKKCCLVSEKDDLNLVVLGVCSRVRADVYQHRLAAQLRLQLRLRRHAGTPELARYVRRRRAAALVPRRGRGAGN